MTIWDVMNVPEPMEKTLKVFFKIGTFFVWNWFWIKWICIAAIIILVVTLIKKRKGEKKNNA